MSYWKSYRTAVDSDKKEDQLLVIDKITMFSYAEIHKDIEQCLDRAIAFHGYRVSPDQKQELRSQMLDFLKNMDEQY